MPRLRALGLRILSVAGAAGLTPLHARPLLAQATPAPPAAGTTTAVAGAVRDSVTGRPLGGAVVLLRDSLDRTIGQTVTDERGRYHLAGSIDGRRLRVLHMGFRPAEAPLTPAGAAPAEVALAPVPPLLTPIRVVAGARARCPRRLNDAAALGLLEQVRAGLLATVIARTEQPAALTVLAYERQYDPLDAAGATAARQQVRVRDATAALAPFGASRTGAEFVADGFRGAGDTQARYYAPDAETLVDDDFVAGYCFRVAAADTGRPHEVGLGFAAARAREGRTDVDGVLWVDTVAHALRSLTFRYAGLDPSVAWLKPGGSMTFREMPSGVAFIDRWSLRLVGGAPQSGARPTGSPDGYSGDAPTGVRYFIQETGGELARVAWPDGRVWHAPLGTVRVHLVDRRGHPAAGVVARLDGTEYSGITDSTGVVELADVLPGPYTVAAADPRVAPPRRGPRAGRRATAQLVAERDERTEAKLVVEMAEQVAVAPPSVSHRTVDTVAVAANAGKTLDQLFTGRFPGVEVTSYESGGLRILIRGKVSSYGADAEPLYVVDGTPQPRGMGGLVHVDPYDIATIEVLKNVEDLSVYGVLGGNGVVRITTRLGTRPR